MILLTFQNFNYVKDYYSPPNTFMLDVTDLVARKILLLTVSVACLGILYFRKKINTILKSDAFISFYFHL